MRNYLFKTLRGRFLGIVLALTLIIGVGVSTFSYILFSRNMEANLIHISETNLINLGNEIEENLTNIKELSVWSRYNSDIIHYLMSDPDNAAYPTFTTSAFERLTEEFTGNPSVAYISRIVIANVNNSKFLQKMSNSYYSSDKNMIAIIQNLPYYDQLIQSSDYNFEIGIQDDPFKNHPEKMIPIIRPIHNPYNNDIIGVSYIQISFALFSDLLTRFSIQEKLPVYLTIGDITYRIDQKEITTVEKPQNIYNVSANNLVHQNTLLQTVKKEGNSATFVSIPLKTQNFYLSVPINKALQKSSQSDYFILLFSIIILVLILGVFLFYFMFYTITRPIERLKQQIDSISKGNLTPDPSIEWNNELGEIGHTVNQLAVNIEHLMNERINFEKQKKDLEYQMLQKQVNPHFMYNTLNSIKWMALAQGSSGIAEMTTALAHLLKNISKSTSSMVSIQEEFHLLNDYYTIQKYRYGGAITMKYHIEDELLLRNQILRFTLQPIIENAIFHGIEPKRQNGHIVINVSRTSEDDILIAVTDDGVGMDEATIQQVLSEDVSDSSGLLRGLGIRSIYQRIQYNFGKQYGISIKSKLGEYTTVSILLPQISDDKEVIITHD